MSKQLGLCLSVLVAIVCAAFVSPPSISEAQGPKSRSTAVRRQHPGQGFWANQRASRNMSHARDYSRGFYNYSRSVQTISPEVAQSEVTQLGRNIEACKNEVATVRKEYEGNKDVADSLAVIDKHLAVATEQQKMLDEECHKDSPDGTVCMHCCNAITKELEKAMAEHAAMMRTLEIKGFETGDEEHSQEQHK